MIECEDGTWVSGEFVRCGAPATVTYTYTRPGVDVDGEDAVFEMKRITCAVGHWYDEMGAVVK